MSGIEEYKSFLAKVKEETGIAAFSPSPEGLASMRVNDSYNLNLQFVQPTGKVLCFVEVAELPADAPKAVYRDLLAGGLFGKDTAGGYFSLEPETETVVYNYSFDLEDAAGDVEEFVRTLEKILQLCDLWAERIKADMKSVGDGESVRSDGSLAGQAVFHA